MPRRKSVAVSDKPKAKTKRVVVRRVKDQPTINQAEIDKLKLLLDEEERVMEADIKQELRNIFNERDQAIKGELTQMDLKNRRLIMWIGVSLFMLSIVSFWVSSLDTVIRGPAPSMYRSIDEAAIDQAKENFSKNLGEVMKEIDRLKLESQKLEAQQKALATSTATQATDNFKPKP